MRRDDRSDWPVPLMARIRAALCDGRREHAAALAAGFSLKRETVIAHDLQRDKITALESWIARTYGEDQLYDAQYASIAPWFGDSLRSSRERTEESRERAITIDREYIVNHVITGQTRGFEDVSVSEDAEKFVIRQRNAGGRLIRDGQFEPGSRLGFYRISVPHPMTFGEANFDVYNSHIAVGMIIDIDRGRHLTSTYPTLWDSDGISVIHVHKDPTTVPGEFYERLGKRKPHDLSPRQRPAPERPFTPEELANLTVAVEDRVRAAIARGDASGAVSLLRQIEDRWAGIRAVYDRWPALLLDWIRNRHGELAAYEALQDSWRLALMEPIESLAALPPALVAERLATVLRAGFVSFSVAEGDGRWEIEALPSRFLRIGAPLRVAFTDDRLEAMLAGRTLLEAIR